jgi:late competence protein required for DNA uptake (superfamily II DNA/RNA helicase)
MAPRKSYSRLSCAECGQIISDRTLWVDDGGLLCRHCAMLTRYRRMKGEIAGLGRRARAAAAGK